MNWEPQAYRLARTVQAPPLEWTGPRDGNLAHLPRVRVRNRSYDDIDGTRVIRPKRADIAPEPLPED